MMPTARGSDTGARVPANGAQPALLLRGATVVDGTGRAGARLDVMVQHGRIAEVGRDLSSDDAVRVDLDGLVLAPGFIDIHTHYDAQVLWDGGLSPSPSHGVTTVVLGNCGFGLAPTQPEHRSLVMAILELVEDMAPEALAEGVRWDFVSFADYLDLIDRLTTRINVACLVGHTPVRIAAMGEDALARPATPAELSEMRRLVRGARQAGAIGLATSLAANHVGPAGRPVPSCVGGLDEVGALVDALGSGVVEIARGMTPVSALAELVRPGVTLSWSSLLTGRPGESNPPSELVDETDALPGAAWPQMSCRPLTIQVTLANPVALGAIPAFREILATEPARRDAVYRDERWRATARRDTGETWRPMWEGASVLVDDVDDPADGLSVVDHARAHRLELFDALVGLALEHGLGTRINIPVANTDEEQLAGLLRDRRTILGLSDAGAHANQQCDAAYATYLLGHWVRERGVLSLEEAVWRLTGQPAQVYGFTDRGVIRRGAAADLVAFDPDRVLAEPLRRVHDLPGGATRLISASRGIEHVWVAGEAIRRDGADLDPSPGRLLRFASAGT